MAQDYASALKLLQSKGYGQADLDRFLGGNKNDLGRVESAFGAQTTAAGAPAPAASTPSMTALNNAVDNGSGGGQPTQPTIEGEGGGQVNGPDMMSMFSRRSLGRRILPQESMSVAALGAKVY